MEQSRSCSSSHPRAWVVGVMMDADHPLLAGRSCDERRGGTLRVLPVDVRLHARSGEDTGFPALSSPSVLIKFGVLDGERFYFLR